MEREKNFEKQEHIVFSFEFDANRKEQREEYHGIDITFWTKESQEKHRVDIVVNVSVARGNSKELEDMKVILKRYDKVVGEGVIEKGLVEFINQEKGVYGIEFVLKEINRGRDFDTFVV